MLDISSISSGLERSTDGIWYSTSDQDISYPSDGNENCFEIEDRSFWFKHRNSCITSLVKSYPPDNHGTIFDIGGGNGFVSMSLTNAGFNIVLVEPGKTGILNAKKRGLKNIICATTTTAKFKQASLPAVGLFDVIEHIENDLDFMESISRLIKKGGRLYVTVPAYSFLWSTEDVSAGHFRRYSLDEITSLLITAGFKIDFATYIFRFLPIPTFLLRALPFKLGRRKVNNRTDTVSRDHAADGGATSKILDSLLLSEIKNLNNHKAMRFGGTCLIAARRL